MMKPIYSVRDASVNDETPVYSVRDASVNDETPIYSVRVNDEPLAIACVMTV